MKVIRLKRNKITLYVYIALILDYYKTVIKTELNKQRINISKSEFNDIYALNKALKYLPTVERAIEKILNSQSGSSYIFPHIKHMRASYIFPEDMFVSIQHFQTELNLDEEELENIIRMSIHYCNHPIDPRKLIKKY